jgi:hypothetical protein
MSVFAVVYFVFHFASTVAAKIMIPEITTNGPDCRFK